MNVPVEMTSVGRQLQVICAQVQILTSWIENRFGVRLVNKEAEVYQGVWQWGKIEEMIKSLGVVQEEGCKRKKRGRPRITRKQSAVSEVSVKDEEEQQVEEDLNPQEFVEAIYVDEKRPKRLSRRRVNYSEDGVNNTLEESKGSGGKKRNKQKDENVEQTVETIDGDEDGRERQKKSVWNSSLPKQCDECGKVLKGTSTLKLHKMMHADERPHTCEVCGNKFRFRRNLKVHMMAVHTGERPLQCSFCGRKFYAPKDLRIHERTHTGEKPYPCTVCPKRFNVKEHLTMHLRVHTGEKPYKCTVCDKAFSQANSLRIHKKIHTRDPSEVKRKNKGKKGDDTSITGSESSWKSNLKDPPLPVPTSTPQTEETLHIPNAINTAIPSHSTNSSSLTFHQVGVTYTEQSHLQPNPSSSNIPVHNSFHAPGDSNWRVQFPPATSTDVVDHHIQQPTDSLRFGATGTTSCRSDPFPPVIHGLPPQPQNDQQRFLNFYSANQQ